MWEPAYSITCMCIVEIFKLSLHSLKVCVAKTQLNVSSDTTFLLKFLEMVPPVWGEWEQLWRPAEAAPQFTDVSQGSWKPTLGLLFSENEDKNVQLPGFWWGLNEGAYVEVRDRCKRWGCFLLNQIVVIYKSFFCQGNRVNSEQSVLDQHQA